MDIVTNLIWSILKYIFVLVLIYVCYLAWKLVLWPYSIRMKYMKYKNVYHYPNFVPFKGELAMLDKNNEAGRFMYQHRQEFGADRKGHDLVLDFFGPIPYMYVYSLEAFKQFHKQVPEKIDRTDFIKRVFGKVFPNSMIEMQSSPQWRERKSKFIKTLGINSVS